eukprot:TRINITY_DN4349_c1_g1_i1.p1 TRINITY_DN4349_c1_g1~~TRINITY_DN4349_c1_g1_i1.p1  ORF type:complete len:729 (+),score=163.45 TRINITY_DN4349_c1_g1_i1:342-2528(+)
MPRRRKEGCPRTEEILRAADEAQHDYRAKRERLLSKDGEVVPLGLREGEVVHVLKGDVLPLMKGAPKFDFSEIFGEMGGEKKKTEQNQGTEGERVADSISESRKLLVDVLQAHHHKNVGNATAPPAASALPEVVRPKTPDAVKQMGRGEDYYAPKRKKRRPKEDGAIRNGSSPDAFDPRPPEPFSDRNSSKGVTRKLYQFVNVSYRRVQRCKFGTVKGTDEAPATCPFKTKAVVTPRADLDDMSLQQYSLEAIRERTKSEKPRVFSLTQCSPTSQSQPQSRSHMFAPVPPSKGLERSFKKKGSFISHELKQMTADLREVEGDDETQETIGGQYALAYKRTTHKEPVEPREPQAYRCFKQGLENRTYALNNRCLAELERCDQRRRMFFSNKYEVLGELSELRNGKHSTWLPAAEELQKTIQSIAVAKDAKQRQEKRQAFLDCARAVIDEYYYYVTDCYVLLDKLSSLFNSESVVNMDQKVFFTLLYQFPTSRLLQDGFRQVLDLVRPIFRVEDEQWRVFLNERFSKFQSTNINLLLETHEAKMSQPPSQTPLRMSLRLFSIKHVDRDPTTCQMMLTVRCDGVWSRPKSYPFDESELRSEIKTSIKKTNKPVWNEEVTIGFERPSTVEFLLYDLNEVDGNPWFQGHINLDHYCSKMYKQVRTKITVHLHTHAFPLPQETEIPAGGKAGDGADAQQATKSPKDPNSAELLISIEALNFGQEPDKRSNMRQK